MAQIHIDVGANDAGDAYYREWKEQASQLQTTFYKTYYDKVWWNGIPNSSNLSQLQHVIGQILFGHATSEGHEDLRKSGYKSKEANRIKHIAKRIMNHFKNNDTSMSLILVCAKWKNSSCTEQVFRVWDNNKEYFIDSVGRVYKNWEAFLTENTYRQCFLCYPAFGLYRLNANEEVLVDYGMTPASDPKHRRLRILDLVALLLSIIGGISLIVSAILDNGTVMYIVAAVIILLGLSYNLYRSVKFFLDLKRHL